MARLRPILGRAALLGVLSGCLLGTPVIPATIFETGAANAGLTLRWPEPAMASLGLAGLARRDGGAAKRTYLLPMPEPVRRHVTIKAAAPVGFTVYKATVSPDAPPPDAPDRSVLEGHWAMPGGFALTVRIGLAGGLAVRLDLPPKPAPPTFLPVQTVSVPTGYRPRLYAQPDQPATVPLPGAGWLVGAGLASLVLLRRRRA